MSSVSTSKSLQELTKRLAGISRKLAEDLEVEELILYPHVKDKIKKYGLQYYTAHKPNKVPKEQI